jgi:glucokinase
MRDTLVMAGDVGGTHARIAFFRARGDGAAIALVPAWHRTYDSRPATGLEEIARRALIESSLLPHAAGFGVAGPVLEGVCRTTNLPWEISAKSVASAINLPRVSLLNDLEATAWGLAALSPEAVVTLQPGVADVAGTQAIIAAGTGLGEGFLTWDGTRHAVGRSEGGHADFGPRDAEQDALLAFLRQRHGHVSWERAVSGPGLVAIAEFLATREPADPALSSLLASEGAAAVTDAARRGDPLAIHAMRLFVTLLGAEAGNLALTVMATGGIFLAGGIAPKIRDFLDAPELLLAFHDKGRMRPVLERMPVRLVLDDGVALLGAARHALLA